MLPYSAPAPRLAATSSTASSSLLVFQQLILLQPLFLATTRSVLGLFTIGIGDLSRIQTNHIDLGMTDREKWCVYGTRRSGNGEGEKLFISRIHWLWLRHDLGRVKFARNGYCFYNTNFSYVVSPRIFHSDKLSTASNFHLFDLTQARRQTITSLRWTFAVLMEWEARV